MSFQPSADLQICAANWSSAKTSAQRQQCYTQALYELRSFVAIDSRSQSIKPEQLQRRDIANIDQLESAIRWFAHTITRKEEMAGMDPQILRKEREKLEHEIIKSVLYEMQNDYASASKRRVLEDRKKAKEEENRKKAKGEDEDVAEQLASMEVSDGESVNEDESEHSEDSEVSEEEKEAMANFLSKDLSSSDNDEDYEASEAEGDDETEEELELEPGELEDLQSGL